MFRKAKEWRWLTIWNVASYPNVKESMVRRLVTGECLADLVKSRRYIFIKLRQNSRWPRLKEKLARMRQ